MRLILIERLLRLRDDLPGGNPRVLTVPSLALPDRQSATVRRHPHHGQVLIAGRPGGERGFRTDLRTVQVEPLGENPLAVAVLAAGAGPDDDEATGSPGDRRLGLDIGNCRVDLDRLSCPGAGDIE